MVIKLKCCIDVVEVKEYKSDKQVAEEFFGFCIVHLFSDGGTDNCTADTAKAHYAKVEKVYNRYSVGCQCGDEACKL